MSDLSARLDLPYLQPAQAQKHVTHNEALQMLDVMVQLAVAEFDAVLPPATPSAGACYALGASPTGDWAANPGDLACWQDSGWVYLTPRPGWRAWDIAAQDMRVWDGTGWVVMVRFPDTLDQLGIQATPDVTNRLSVQSPASLFSHAGAGHQMKINKAAAADTASLLFQSTWTGHAEMGLTGNNAFSIKTSPDGSSWTTNLVADATGLYPGTDDTQDLGSATARFHDIHATNGVIQTSDREEKQDIAPLSPAERRVAQRLRKLIVTYRWRDSVAKKGPGARRHIGIIAQDVQAAFAAEGLSAEDYALVENGETSGAKPRLGIRYPELFAFIIAAL